MADVKYVKAESCGNFGLNRRRKILLIILSGVVFLAGVSWIPESPHYGFKKSTLTITIPGESVAA